MKAYLVGAVLALFGSGAIAAEIKSSTLKDGRVVISLSGEISPGDTDALKAAIKTANDAGKLAASIRLNSEGGNLLEGVRLAEAVKFAKMTTNVGLNDLRFGMLSNFCRGRKQVCELFRSDWCSWRFR